jgi:O-methyltransferase involved in polyketide biosynthesis
VETLRQVAKLAPGSTFVMTFLVPFEEAHANSQQGFKQAAKGAQQAGTPFISFFKPAEMLKLAGEAGFRKTQHVSPSELTQRYFANRPDGLRPPDNAEEILVANT